MYRTFSTQELFYLFSFNCTKRTFALLDLFKKKKMRKKISVVNYVNITLKIREF